MAAAVGSANIVKDEESCGYCLQKLPYMEAPRQLPCSHLFCLSCLQSDVEENGVLKCIICSQFCEKLDLDSLPSVQGMSRNERLTHEEPEVEIVPCDVCEELKSISDCYCSQCMKNFCEQHLKVHNSIVGSGHPLVFYKSVISSTTCKEHQNKTVSLACSLCHELFCGSCEIEPTCEWKSGFKDQEHQIVQLERLSEKLDGWVMRTLKTLSCRITNLSKQEKTAWNDADDIKERVQELTEEVDRVAAQQISAVANKASSLKRELADYMTKVVEETETRTAKLTSRADCMQTLWKSTRKLSLTSHSGVVKSYARLSSSGAKDLLVSEIPPIGNTEDDLLYSPPLPDNLLGIRSLTTHLSKFPNRMKFVKTASLSQITSVHLDSQQLIITRHALDMAACTCNDQLKMIHKFTECQPIIALAALSPQGFAPYSHVVISDPKFSKHYKSPSRQATLEMTMEDLKPSIQIDTFTVSSWDERCCGLAVNLLTKQIFVVNNLWKHIKLYDNGGNYLWEVPICCTLKSNPDDIRILPDGSIILLFIKTPAVGKFEFNANTRTLREVWLIQTIPTPTSISFDSEGNIFVSSQSEKCIRILSPSGKLVGKFHHYQLRNARITNVDVSGNLIAIGTRDTITLMHLVKDR